MNKSIFLTDAMPFTLTTLISERKEMSFEIEKENAQRVSLYNYVETLEYM